MLMQQRKLAGTIARSNQLAAPLGRRPVVCRAQAVNSNAASGPARAPSSNFKRAHTRQVATPAATAVAERLTTAEAPSAPVVDVPMGTNSRASRYIETLVVPTIVAQRLAQFADAENIFLQLASTPDLDEALESSQQLQAAAQKLDAAVQDAIRRAYYAPQGQMGDAAAHLFLQRLLYRVNRLNFFWFDDLTNYQNERSFHLQRLRNAIEAPWHNWELAQLARSNESAVPGAANGAADPAAAVMEGYRGISLEDIQTGLRDRYARDVDPEPSPALRYIRDDMGTLAYCHLLAVGSVDGLVEASRQSRVCGGAANEVSCMVFRVLSEEYGTGRMAKKHSTFYKAMMQHMGLQTAEEAYLDLLPWEALATANHNFLMTERRRHYLRYCGGLSFFEINGPAVYKSYLSAGQRAGLPESAWGYWALHIKEDERHGRQMLEEVSQPLAAMYPADGWEVLLGYDQEAFMGARAGAAVVADIQEAQAAAAGTEFAE